MFFKSPACKYKNTAMAKLMRPCHCRFFFLYIFFFVLLFIRSAKIESPTAAAFNIGIAEIAGQTLASHGAERERIDDQTLGVDSARFDGRARVNALSVETGVFAGTFSVGSASCLDYRWLFCWIHFIFSVYLT